MSDAELIKQLGEVLAAAQAHLDYCGYGDRWERGGAMQEKLPEKIQDALLSFDKWKEINAIPTH